MPPKKKTNKDMIHVYIEYLTAFILTWIALILVLTTVVVAVILFKNPKTKERK